MIRRARALRPVLRVRYMRDMSFIMTHMGLEPDPWRESHAKLRLAIPLDGPGR